MNLKDLTLNTHFWYGDVFIEFVGDRNVGDRDHEGYHIYHDMPIEFLDSQIPYLNFNYQWAEGSLGKYIEEENQLKDFSEQMERDKELVFQRLYGVAHDLMIGPSRD